MPFVDRQTEVRWRMSLRLGELELTIMEYIWELGRSVTVPEVHEHLRGSRDLAYTTVMTVMTRLHEKGVLDRVEEKRPYTYTVAVSREDYFSSLLVAVLDEVSDRESVLARFVERVGPEDAALLARLARKARARR